VKGNIRTKRIDVWRSEQLSEALLRFVMCPSRSHWQRVDTVDPRVSWQRPALSSFGDADLCQTAPDTNKPVIDTKTATTTKNE
jgi:hypothetical protein